MSVIRSMHTHKCFKCEAYFIYFLLPEGRPSAKNTKKKHSHRFIPTSRDQKSVNLWLNYFG